MTMHDILTRAGMLAATAALAAAVAPAAALAENGAWAYGYELGSEDCNVGIIYYVDDYFTGEDLVDPATGEAYTQDAIDAIVEAGDEGEEAREAEGYMYGLPPYAMLGITNYSDDRIAWFDSEAAETILSYTDPLTLDNETGNLTDADGAVVAEHMHVNAGYGYEFASEEHNLGKLIYSLDYFVEGAVSPLTGEAYTAEELASITDYTAEDNYYYLPEDCMMAIIDFSGENTHYYDADAAAAIVSHADALDMEDNGDMVDADGNVVAECMYKFNCFGYEFSSEEHNLGALVFSFDYYVDGTVSPLTGEAYTAEELEAILGETAEGRYFYGMPEGAMMAVIDFSGENTYFYDADATAAIVAHTDALDLDENGNMVDAEGNVVAEPMEIEE